MALLFRFDRGLCFVDRPGPARIWPPSRCWARKGYSLRTVRGGSNPPTPGATARKPLAGEFRYNGQTLFVIANHFNSRADDDPLFRALPASGPEYEAQRREQAQVERDFISALLALDPQARVDTLGDLNDFEFSPRWASSRART